jgi:outer membrane receptor protein involved in Fe transport
VVLQRGKNLSNPNLKWETTLTRNIGLDFGFWNGRLSGSLDAYWNTTKDLLMQTTLPKGAGYEFQYQNFGQTSNKGIELALDAILVDQKDFGLNFNFNISYNQAKIDKLPTNKIWQSSGWGGSLIAGIDDFLIEEGGRLGEVYGYKLDGFYTTEDFTWDNGWKLKEGRVNPTESGMKVNNFGPGSPKLKANADGKIEKERLGNTIPKITGGFGINARYKSFDLSAFFNYSLGNKIINATKLASGFYSDTKKDWNLNNEFNLSKRYTWIDPANGMDMTSKSYINEFGSDYAINRLNEINAGASIFNPASITQIPLLDWAVEDGAFLRVNNISIGYTLPKVFVQKLQMQNVRIYFTGYNLYCFTKYSGADPEVDTCRKTPMTPGIDYSAYPKSRSFVGGINVTF